jgi:hypothetical protein
MQAETPPTYSEYPTELPDLFPIGQDQVKPLVSVTELQAHLKLLGAFYELKREVQNQPSNVEAGNKDEAWVVFVNRAVYRFFAWTSEQWNLPGPELYVDEVPPLDVLMVWHTYLLVRVPKGSIDATVLLTSISSHRILCAFMRIKAVCKPRTPEI